MYRKAEYGKECFRRHVHQQPNHTQIAFLASWNSLFTLQLLHSHIVAVYFRAPTDGGGGGALSQPFSSTNIRIIYPKITSSSSSLLKLSIAPLSLIHSHFVSPAFTSKDCEEALNSQSFPTNPVLIINALIPNVGYRICGALSYTDIKEEITRQ